MLERGDASALVVAKLDRLSRSMLDFSKLMNKAQKESWAAALAVPPALNTPMFLVVLSDDRRTW